MKAWVYEKYGNADVLEQKDIDKPIPQKNEVLIRVQAASINVADWYMLNGKPFVVRFMAGGILKPKRRIPGADVSGVIEAIGEDVKGFKAGDKIYGDILGAGKGAMSEYVAVAESILGHKPENLTFEEAATIPLAGVTALKAIRDSGKVQPGQKVLIYGASGGVGSFAIQIAKSFGAEVTAVCSTRNLEVARSIGADHVIDYTKEDFVENGEKYDVILAANGYRTLSDYKKALNSGGIYVCSGGRMKQIFASMLLGPIVFAGGNKKIATVSSKADKKDLAFLKEMIEGNKVKPVIDKIYSFDQAAEAMKYLGQGHARGKIVINVRA